MNDDPSDARSGTVDAEAPQPGIGPDTRIDVTYRMTASDYRSATIQMTRQSVGSVAIGAFLTGIAIIPILNGDLPSWVTLLFGLSLVSGLYCLPFIWWGIRRRHDLLFAEHELHADSDGIDVTTPLTKVHQAWPTFRRVRELSNLFLLDYGTGANAIVPARAFDLETTARFRALVVREGKLERTSPWQNWVKGAGLGALVAVAFVVVIALLANR